VLTNSLVNNVTNLTVILALPALVWGLDLNGTGKNKKPSRKKIRRACRHGRGGINRLSLLLTLGAVFFFHRDDLGVWRPTACSTRAMDSCRGALSFFGSHFKSSDVLKHNVTRRKSFSVFFYVDVLVLLARRTWFM